ncbi:MAG: hypothetical protein KA436_09050 [Oligoflexales bacterium]|nr:hypothetical protein [Oligoflexales bacterium]
MLFLILGLSSATFAKPSLQKKVAVARLIQFLEDHPQLMAALINDIQYPPDPYPSGNYENYPPQWFPHFEAPTQAPALPYALFGG